MCVIFAYTSLYKNFQRLQSGNIWMHKLFSQNEGSDCLPFFFFFFVKIFAPLENFSLIWSYRWRAAKFDLYSELMDIDHWRFLACHTYCDTGHRFIFSSPRTRDIHNSYRALSIGAVITCFTTCIRRGCDSKTQPFACEVTALTDCVTMIK